MNIADITCEKLIRFEVVDGHEVCTLEDTEYVKSNWDKMTELERSGWYTTTEHTFIPRAEDVLEGILESVSSWDYWYDGVEDVVENSVITFENKEKLQRVLNEIFSNEGCKSYIIDKRIS